MTLNSLDPAFTEGFLRSKWLGARLTLSSDVAILAATDTAVPWSQAERSVGTWWSGSNPTRLVVPAGVTRVVVRSTLLGSNASSQLFGRIQKNGVDFIGMARSDTSTSGSDTVNMVSDVIDVVAGDYFECIAHSDNARNITADPSTWFSIEAIEGTLYDATMSTPVAFHAHRTTTQMAGVVVFDVEDLDEGSDYNVTNGAFTAPVNGVYHFYAAAVIDNTANAGDLYIRVNGTRMSRGHSFVSSGTQNDTHSVSFTIRLNAGDTVDVDSSFTLAASGTPWNYFGGYLLNASTGNQPINVINETSTTLTSIAAHANGYVGVNNNANITYTVQDDTLVNHDIGTTISIEQVGSGQVTVAAGVGVTVRSAAASSTRTQYSVIMLTKVAADTWNLTGDLTP